MIETFTIPIYEWKTVDVGQKTIRIKGVALRGDVVSKNNRKYTREALMRATNTWIGKPVNINHDDTKKAGTVKWMDYDEGSDLLLYEAEINREPYVTLLRNKSAEIRGLSIQADYLYTVCAKCGERFYTEEEWHDHVVNEEFMRDMPTQPHGIMGSAISLVLSPEIPGYDGTTYELAEIARQATLRLLETVIKTKQEEEKYKMSKIALRTNTGNIAVGKSGVKGILEQEEEPASEPEVCPEGQHRDPDTGKCVPDTPPEQATEQEEMTEEQIKTKMLQIQKQIDNLQPILTEAPAEPSPQEKERQIEIDALRAKYRGLEDLLAQKARTSIIEQEHKCPEGEHWDETEGKCVANVMEQEEHKCGEDEHWSETEGKCVKNTPPETTELLTVKLKPFKVSETAPKLKLGEPFAGYDNFEDCVAKNQEKDNPEAYCGTIKKEAEGQAQERKETAEKLNEIITTLNSLKASKDDVSWQPRMAHAELQVKTLTESVKALPINMLQNADTQLRNKIATIKPYNDKSLIEKIEAIKPYDDTEIKQKLDEALQQIQEIPKLKETIAQQKTEFDNLLDSADKSVKEHFEANKKEMEADKDKIKELEQKLSDAETKKLKETENLETRVVNLEDKLQPQFKARAQKAKQEKKQSPDLSYKPGGK